MRCMALQFSCNQISRYDPPAFPVDHHHVHHLMTCKHFDLSFRNLPAQSGISPEQQLLARLTLGVECSRNLNPSKTSVVQQTAILPSERHTLCHALVDDAG